MQIQKQARFQLPFVTRKELARVIEEVRLELKQEFLMSTTPLSDAITQLNQNYSDLKTRVEAHEANDAATIAKLQALVDAPNSDETAATTSIQAIIADMTAFQANNPPIPDAPAVPVTVPVETAPVEPVPATSQTA